MKKDQKINLEVIRQFVIFYQMVSEANDLESEISELIRNNRPEDSELIRAKYEIFFNNHINTGKKVDKHLSLSNGFSAIFETDINALAIEKILWDKNSTFIPLVKNIQN